MQNIVGVSRADLLKSISFKKSLNCRTTTTLILFFCGCAVWLQWNVRCISRILASPLQGEPSSGLMQYGCPLLLNWNWNDGQPVLISSDFFVCCGFSLCFRYLSIVCLYRGCRWSWQKLISFAFFCLSGLRPEWWSLVFPSDEIKTLAFEENHPQCIMAELIAAACQHTRHS